MDSTESDPWRIVLLGKTGVGRSSLGNTIFGQEDDFNVTHSSTSEPKLYQSKSRVINGRILQLIEAPGLQDTDSENTHHSPEFLTCLQECAPGSHAFLIVLKVEAFTVQEQAVVDLIQIHLSEEVLRFTTVVFTHGDQLKEGTKIEDWARENGTLCSLVEKCGGRCHVFDNKYWNGSQDTYRSNQYQVRELLKSIEQTVMGNVGGFYTREMLNTAQELKESRECNEQDRGNICQCCLEPFLCCIPKAFLKCFSYEKIN